MTVIRFEVHLDDDAQEVADELEERLGALDGVEEVQAEPSEPQAIGEIMLVVAGAVAVTRGARELIDELKRLVESWRDLKRTLFVEVDGEQVDVRDIGEAELEKL